MITIYHLGASQSDRIVWLMEELGLPYELVWFDRLPSMLAPPEYKALHPVATAPTIRDGDLVMCESVAIIEYIVNRHGAGRLGVAADKPNYPDYLYWMQFNQSLMSAISVNMVAKAVPGADDNVFAQSSRDRITRYYNQLEQRLGESDYLAGREFTAADIQNLFAFTTMPRFGGPAISHLKNLSAYVDRVTARPAYRKAMAIAGPDAARPS
ncbi:MAG: glutathione S-transferase [Porticoccaceae bacterium]